MRITIAVNDQTEPTIIDTGTDDVGESWDYVLEVFKAREAVTLRWYGELLRDLITETVSALERVKP